MTDRFEQSIKDWYEHSRTASLEFLNLSEKEKPNFTTLDNNLSCVYNQITLLAKISIKNFQNIFKQLDKLDQRLELCEENIRKTQSETLKSLQQIFGEIQETKPLTKKQVFELVSQISQQPKLVEEQALKLSEDLNQKVQKVENLLQEVKALIA